MPAAPILTTKLYVPPPRPQVVLRPRLIERLNEGLNRRLTLVCAPAGFGKTTLLAGWVAGCDRPAAWLSLDEGDNDPTRFLAYLVAALQTVAPKIGAGVLGALQSPQPPPDRAAASQAYTEVISTGRSFGDSIYTTAATINLGQLQEADNQLPLATRTYRRVLQLAGDPPQRMACEAYLGLARIAYQGNDLDTAGQHGQQCLQLTRQMESVDTFASYDVFLACLKLARGDAPGAAAVLAEAEAFVRHHEFAFRMTDIAAAQVLTLLHQGDLAAADHLAQTHELPISQARVHLAQGDPSTALAALEPLRRRAEVKGWQDERLKVMVLQALALHAHDEKDKAAQLLGDALALAEPGGFIRIFVDEGRPMARLLSEATARGIMPEYTARLLAVFEAEEQKSEDKSDRPDAPPAQPLIEPLSQRELEVLRLIAQGLSNREICERLFLALDTVKGHNRRIFGKLSVQRRTEAVAKARSLGILPRHN
jgi:LuxR family transcriptional regulator, maltose regulon positive regulatory protein